jgi:hypothetical protein
VSPEREKLGDLIARLGAAETYVKQVHQAMGRANEAVFDANDAFDASSNALAEAKQGAAAYHVAALISGKDGDNPVAKAEVTLAEADTALTHARSVRDMLAAELAAAEKAVVDRRSYLRESKGRALRAAPESAAWLAKRQRQKAELAETDAVCRSSPPPAACPTTGTSSAPLNETPCNPRPSLPGWLPSASSIRTPRQSCPQSINYRGWPETSPHFSTSWLSCGARTAIGDGARFRKYD